MLFVSSFIIFNYIIYVSGAKILEEKIILDNKNISCFSIKFIKELTEYDMLSIYNELNRYCEKIMFGVCYLNGTMG